MEQNAYHLLPTRVAYRDPIFRIVICLIGSHITVVYGEAESVFKSLLNPAYYISLFGSFIIAIILFSFIRRIQIGLDKKYSWQHRTTVRICMQIIFGLLIPGILAFMLAALYFQVRGGINILETSYPLYDFQFILLQLLLINLYYTTYYFYWQWHHAEHTLIELTELKARGDNHLGETYPVSKGANSILLPINEIAYFFREKANNFLRTTSEEDFIISQSLDEVQQQLPEKEFFRANRQVIVNRIACKGFNILAYGKLRAVLSPGYKENVIISQKRSPAFKKWIEFNNPNT